RGVLGALDERAQRRVALEVAGLDDDAAFVVAEREQRLDRRRDVAAAGLDPHRALAAEQRNGLRLLDETRRLGRQRVAFEPRQRERIVRIEGDALSAEPSRLVEEAQTIPL